MFWYRKIRADEAHETTVLDRSGYIARCKKIVAACTDLRNFFIC